MPDLNALTDAAELFAAVEPKRAMVITAHPDDCEFMCGGTVAVLTRGGWEVDIMVATSGNKGTKDPQVSAQWLAGTREDEQREAARRLGAREPIFLGMHDGGVQYDDELRETIVNQMRRRRPELVITWDGFRPGFNHRDHRNVGRATYDAIFPAADDHLYHPELAHTSQMRGRTEAQLLALWKQRAAEVGETDPKRVFAEAYRRVIFAR